MRPGSYDVHQRVRDMNRNGILSSMCFPSFAGFSARFFQEAKDKDLALACVEAYNNHMVEEWCGDSGGVLIPLAFTIIVMMLPPAKRPHLHLRGVSELLALCREQDQHH